MMELDRAVLSLENWIDKNGWAGYDPYDIKAKRLIRPLQRSRVGNKALNVFLDRFPMAARKIFYVRRRIYSKAMGLFADAFLNRFEKTGEERYLLKAEECLEWLVDKVSTGYTGCCWGYPFDWQSLILIPEGTPSGVVTSVVIRAFLHAHKLTGKAEYLEVCRSACAFISKDLNRVVEDEDQLCFSYTPLDDFRVLNANMFCAASLAGTAAITGDCTYLKDAVKSVNYTMTLQQEDGAWYYWGPPNIIHRFIDNYHTGFVLECAQRCRDVFGRKFTYLEELAKGLDFYRNNMFLDNGLARISNTRTYPVDIHSCAQGIITLCTLHGIGNGCIEDAVKVALWTIANMQDDAGFFYYRLNRGYTNRMPFIRWGQAWMMYALSRLQLSL